MNSPFSPGDSVFGYGRDSGGDQKDLSIAQQESAVQDWCREHGLLMSRFFTDEAKRGSSVIGRDGLQALMQRFRHGCAERGVIVWKYNRFSRDVDNAQFYRAEIRTLGYSFYSLMDQVPEGPMGRIFEAIIDYKDQQYLADLSTDIKRGLNDLVRNFGCVPGTPPRGFLREPVQIGTHRDGTPHLAHRWKPDPALIPLVRLAFELRAKRTPLSRIQEQTGIYTIRSCWRTFFSNPIYKGVLSYGDLVIENYCEPLVSPALWARVQLVQGAYTHRQYVKSSAAAHPRRTASRFVLSGIAHCALCGRLLTGHSSHHPNGNVIESYICKGRDHNAACRAKRIPRDVLEAAIMDALRQSVLDPANYASAVRSVNASRSALLAEQQRRIHKHRADLASVRRQLANVADAVEQNGTSRTLNARLQLLEHRQADLESALAKALAEPVGPLHPLPAGSVARLAGYIEKVWPASTIDEQRQLLHAFIRRVDAYRDGQAVRGVMQYYVLSAAPEKDGGAPGVPIDLDTPGASRYTHTVEFVAPVRFTKRRP